MKRLFSNSDTTTITTKNKLFDALVKPILLYGCEIWGPELLSYKTHFDKSTIEEVHIKFCKQTINTPWYIENIACRAELGRYPLSIDIEASIFSYWLRLQHETVNPLLKKHFITQEITANFLMYQIMTKQCECTLQAIHQANSLSRMLVLPQRNSLKRTAFEIGWRLAATLPNAPERNLHIKKSDTTTNWKTISELSETQHIEYVCQNCVWGYIAWEIRK